MHTSPGILINCCRNASDFLGWRYLQFYFLLLEFVQLQTQNTYKQASNFLLGQCTLFIWRIPTDKNFKASFFNWYVFPFQLVQSANTKFQLIKIHRNLTLIRLGFLKVVFSICPPPPTSFVSLQQGNAKKILWKEESQWKEGENLHIFWTTLGISMKFSEKMWLMIILSH